MLGHWSHHTVKDSGCRLDPPSLMEWGLNLFRVKNFEDFLRQVTKLSSSKSSCTIKKVP